MEKDPTRFRGISEELLEGGMDVRISTSGISMFPVISTGDKITISPAEDYRTGDLVVFKRDDRMVCHRLVRIFEKSNSKYFQTRGDSFFHHDEAVTADQILGKVIRVERGRVSLSRRFLLLIHPLLISVGTLNAFVISSLLKIRSAISH